MVDNLDSLAVDIKDRYHASLSWNISKQVLEDVKGEVGYGFYEGCRKVLRIHEPNMVYEFDVKLPRGKYNLPLEPGKNYSFELGILCELDKKLLGTDVHPVSGNKVQLFFKKIASVNSITIPWSSKRN